MPGGTEVSSFVVFASYSGEKGAWPVMKKQTALSLEQSSGQVLLWVPACGPV